MKKSLVVTCLLLTACGAKQERQLYVPPVLSPPVAVSPPASLDAAAVRLLAAAESKDVETVATFLAPDVTVFGRPVDFGRFDHVRGKHTASERRLAALGAHTGNDAAAEGDEVTWHAREELRFLSLALRHPRWGSDPTVPGAICSYQPRRPATAAIEAARRLANGRTMDLAVPARSAAVRGEPAAGAEVIGEVASDRYYIVRQAGGDAPDWYAVLMPDGRTGYASAATTHFDFSGPSDDGVCFREGADGSWTIVSQIHRVGG